MKLLGSFSHGPGREGKDRWLRNRSQQPRFRPMGFSHSRRKNYAVKNLVSALHPWAVKYILSDSAPFSVQRSAL